MINSLSLTCVHRCAIMPDVLAYWVSRGACWFRCSCQHKATTLQMYIFILIIGSKIIHVSMKNQPTLRTLEVVWTVLHAANRWAVWHTATRPPYNSEHRSMASGRVLSSSTKVKHDVPSIWWSSATFAHSWIVIVIVSLRWEQNIHRHMQSPTDHGQTRIAFHIVRHAIRRHELAGINGATHVVSIAESTYHMCASACCPIGRHCTALGCIFIIAMLSIPVMIPV